MVNNEDHEAELRQKQAQAMLDLFEGDRQRPAASLEELREWASSHDQEQLQWRVDRYLEYESEVRRTGCRARPAPPRGFAVLDSTSESAVLRRNRDAATLAVEAEIASVIREAQLAARDVLRDAAPSRRRVWWKRVTG